MSCLSRGLFCTLLVWVCRFSTNDACVSWEIDTVFWVSSLSLVYVFGDNSISLSGPVLEDLVSDTIQSLVALQQRLSVAGEGWRHTVRRSMAVGRWELSYRERSCRALELLSFPNPPLVSQLSRDTRLDFNSWWDLVTIASVSRAIGLSKVVGLWGGVINLDQLRLDSWIGTHGVTCVCHVNACTKCINLVSAHQNFVVIWW